MTTTTSAEQAAKARARADELTRQVEAEQAARAQARQAGLDEHDRQMIAGWREESDRIEQEGQAAYAAFQQAVRDDPVLSAWTAYRAARWRRQHLHSYVAAAISRTGSDVQRPPDLSYCDPRLLEDVLDACEQDARNLAGDAEQQWYAARDAAADRRL